MDPETSEKPVILHAMLAKGFGGIEAAFLRYTEGLLALGYRVHVVTAPESAAARRLPPGVENHVLPQVSQWDLRALWRAWQLVRALQPEVILTHGNRASRMMRWARGRVPQVVVLHRPRFKGLAAYHRVIAVTEVLRQGAMATGLPGDRVMTLPNFLPLPEGWTPSPRPSVRHRPPVIGFLGRFVPEKGADLLIEALRLLKDHGCDFRALLGGDGPGYSDAEKSIIQYGLQDRVQLLGWVSDASAFYPEIDLLCVPSRQESFGLIVLEAWAQGLPVVATRTSGPESLVVHGETGLLADISAPALAEQLQRLLTDATLYARLGQGSAAALAPYRMEAILPRLRVILESLRKTIV